MFVKICGTTSLADAELAIRSGADAVGFVFAPSRRRVSPAQVAEITRHMPEGTGRVGVFCTPDAHEILATVQEARLTAVQLHMPQDPALLAVLAAALPESVSLWQVVSFETAAETPATAESKFKQELLRALMDPRISAVLLDTSKAGRSGGTGESFPWHRAAPLLRRAEENAKQLGNKTATPILIAGGLTPENVGEAVEVLSPWGVDCVSGVEREPGLKNPDRVEAFVRAAHKAH